MIPPSSSPLFIAVQVFLVCCLGGLPQGCSSHFESEQKTLFDEEHHVPEHWPDGLDQLAKDFRRRLDEVRMNLTQEPDARKELSDLVTWTDEIAADSDLDENRWNQLHATTQRLQQQLAREGGEWSETSLRLGEKLATELDGAVEYVRGLQLAREQENHEREGAH